MLQARGGTAHRWYRDLGLAFVRRVVEGLRGKLTLDSREGEGTTVRIELPRASWENA